MFSGNRIFYSAICVIFAFIIASEVRALEQPTGTVILTITGKVGESNSAQGAILDLAMLQKLPQRSFTTRTPWDKDPVQFKGPLLRDVLAAVKANGTSIKALALNDYQTVIPVEDAKMHDVVLAHQINGQAIPVRTKGPLFIIYPFDSKPELQSQKFYERSAWQLKLMKIE